ncbi:MAG: polyprenyl synthetase family protein [Burkholderiales bacterium]|nr:polyprenyl synthetase family protein [Burkholderiales bacterium]
MLLDFLKAPIGADLARVDAVLREGLRSEVALIRQIAEYIVGGGGKRLRPALLLLAARACGDPGNHRHVLAAVVEMIHTATLLHDDVVDESSQRRGRATANAAFGNAASVLVGDFLYSRAFQMMVGVSSMRVLEILSDATNVIAEGEVLQLMHAGDASLGEDAYLEVIRRKTAKLFEAAARLGAVLGRPDAVREEAYASYGRHLGSAFQIMDDVLDYTGDAGTIGKSLGDDLAEGKMTLPLIRALAVGSPAVRARIRHAIEEGGRLDDFAAVTAALAEAGAIDYARERARQEARLAADALAPWASDPEVGTLLQLATFSADRTN